MTVKCCWLSLEITRKMSVSLFDAVPAGAIEVLADRGLPQFKRADLGRFLGLADVKRNYSNVATKSRSELIRPGIRSTHPRSGMLGGGKNPHDAFVDLEGALEIVVRSRKPKAVELTKWLAHKGVKKVVEDRLAAQQEQHQKAIDEIDTQLALLNDDLTESQKLVKQFDKWATKLQYNNIGLQGEIARLSMRFVPNAMDPGKDNVIMIVRKHTCQQDDSRFEYPYYCARIQRRAIPTKRRWILEQFPRSEEIVVIDNPNGVHAFNRFEEEEHVKRYKCHFRLVDLTREDLYSLGVPAIDV